MSKKRTYEIAFVGLKPGPHEFKYEVDDAFFGDETNREFSNCHATIRLQLDKKTGFMLLKFEIGGKVDVVCDRCGNKLTMDLWDDFNMVVKIVDNPEEMNQQEEDPDVYYISRTESHLHLNEWIYEFVSLSVPLQKMCSEQEMGGPQCNKEVLEMLKNLEAKNEGDNAKAIWKDLEKFKRQKKQ